VPGLGRALDNSQVCAKGIGDAQESLFCRVRRSPLDATDFALSDATDCGKLGLRHAAPFPEFHELHSHIVSIGEHSMLTSASIRHTSQPFSGSFLVTPSHVGLSFRCLVWDKYHNASRGKAYSLVSSVEEEDRIGLSEQPEDLKPDQRFRHPRNLSGRESAHRFKQGLMNSVSLTSAISPSRPSWARAFKVWVSKVVGTTSPSNMKSNPQRTSWVPMSPMHFCAISV